MKCRICGMKYRAGRECACNCAVLRPPVIDEVSKFVVRLPTVEQVASKFVELLRRDLTEEELIEVRRLNKVETDMVVCHSHDFLDANMTMDEALGGFGISIFNADGEMNEEVSKLWNDAWSLVRRDAMI